MAETVQYRYNVRDELLEQTSSVSGLTTNAYDANGSQVRSVSSDGTVTAYGYNVRNKMVAVSTQLPGEQMTERSSYVYDDAGHRTSQTTGSVRTDYLMADVNPTGYSKPVEEMSSAGGGGEGGAFGMPIRAHITAGPVADCTQASVLIKGLNADFLIADRGYDTDDILEQAA